MFNFVLQSYFFFALIKYCVLKQLSILVETFLFKLQYFNQINLIQLLNVFIQIIKNCFQHSKILQGSNQILNDNVKTASHGATQGSGTQVLSRSLEPQNITRNDGAWLGKSILQNAFFFYSCPKHRQPADPRRAAPRLYTSTQATSRLTVSMACKGDMIPSLKLRHAPWEHRHLNMFMHGKPTIYILTNICK